jgi:hypothetical protein
MCFPIPPTPAIAIFIGVRSSGLKHGVPKLTEAGSEEVWAAVPRAKRPKRDL